MNVYKLSTQVHSFKKITRESFERDTQKRYPWWQTSDQGRAVHFAVCPHCNNPIQIIGLIQLGRANINSPRPYGKHYNKTVAQVASLKVETREYCPYYSKRRLPKNANDCKERMDDISREIIQIMVNKFDRIVYFAQRITGIVFKRYLLKAMLQEYRNNKGYLYIDATLTNIPLIFLSQASSLNLYRQAVKNLQLKDAIVQKVPNAGFDAAGCLVPRDSNGVFLDVHFCFQKPLGYVCRDTYELHESIVLSVTGRAPTDMLYQETIEFDHTYFNNILNMNDFQSIPSVCELAKDILGDLL
ncbi:MAG: hypothetical protein RBR45_12535 [Pseudomonas sp.]|nr:hypothetical protein [Pseudomonas sp.]